MVSAQNCNKSIKCCPVEATFEHIGKKWSINILRDLFMGKKRFREFLETNKKLSGKVLSQRLRDLEKHKLIHKKIVSKTPLKAEYALTEKGRNLNKVLYEVIMFSMKNYPKQVFAHPPKKCNEKTFSMIAKRSLGLK